MPGLGQEWERERKNQAECGYPPDDLSTVRVSAARCVSVFPFPHRLLKHSQELRSGVPARDS